MKDHAPHIKKIPAELQWRLLPQLTFVSPRVAVAGGLAPTAEVAGDSFDYALNGARMHATVIDAMGHGLQATLLSGVAIAALGNARRGGLDLAGTVAVIDAAIGARFGPDKFVTGIGSGSLMRIQNRAGTPPASPVTGSCSTPTGSSRPATPTGSGP